jgi:hypothetical protein
MNAPSKFPVKQLGGPVRFSPSMERLDADEAKTIQGLIATMRYINEKTFADGGHAIRSVHAKTHGILEGCLEVNADLPSDLAQGLFAKPGRYPIVMRFSTIPGDILDDSVSTPRGLAVKIIGVKGERLSGVRRGRYAGLRVDQWSGFWSAQSEDVSIDHEIFGKNHRQG